MADGGQQYVIPTHDQAYVAHVESFERINSRLGDHDTFINKFITITADQRASLDRIHERLDEWKEQTSAIVSLGKSVEHMIKQQDQTQENITKMLEKQGEQDLKIHGIETQMYSTKIAKLEEHFEKKYVDLEEQFEQKYDDLEEQFDDLKNKPGKTALRYIDNVASYLVIALVVFLMGAVWYYLQGNL